MRWFPNGVGTRSFITGLLVFALIGLAFMTVLGVVLYAVIYHTIEPLVNLAMMLTGAVIGSVATAFTFYFKDRNTEHDNGRGN